MLTTDMDMKTCEKCENEMRLIPAGFSAAKNKAYTAFWSCDKRMGGCGATANYVEPVGDDEAVEREHEAMKPQFDAEDREAAAAELRRACRIDEIEAKLDILTEMVAQLAA